jgi:hypothetical protein
MAPHLLLYPLAVIGITAIYAVWLRFRLDRSNEPEHALRERVAYMLWIAANRA